MITKNDDEIHSDNNNHKNIKEEEGGDAYGRARSLSSNHVVRRTDVGSVADDDDDDDDGNDDNHDDDHDKDDEYAAVGMIMMEEGSFKRKMTKAKRKQKRSKEKGKEGREGKEKDKEKDKEKERKRSGRALTLSSASGVRSNKIGGGEFSGDHRFVIRLIGRHHVGLLHEIAQALHQEGLVS